MMRAAQRAAAAVRARATVKEDDVIAKWKIVRGDMVQVMAGKDKGKQGEVIEVKRAQNRVVVAGLNLVKKHVRSQGEQKGGIFSREAPIHVSNVALLDPKDQRPTRVSMRYVPEGDGYRKVRLARRSGLVIERPSILTKKREVEDGPKDTPPELVFGSYQPSLTPFKARPA